MKTNRLLFISCLLLGSGTAIAADQLTANQYNAALCIRKTLNAKLETLAKNSPEEKSALKRLEKINSHIAELERYIQPEKKVEVPPKSKSSPPAGFHEVPELALQQTDGVIKFRRGVRFYDPASGTLAIVERVFQNGKRGLMASSSGRLFDPASVFVQFPGVKVVETGAALEPNTRFLVRDTLGYFADIKVSEFYSKGEETYLRAVDGSFQQFNENVFYEVESLSSEKRKMTLFPGQPILKGDRLLQVDALFANAQKQYRVLTTDRQVFTLDGFSYAISAFRDYQPGGELRSPRLPGGSDTIRYLFTDGRTIRAVTKKGFIFQLR